MRRGNRSDVVVRPKRAPATTSKKAPTLAELATRVKWLEECQRANVETVEALRVQTAALTDRLAGVEWRERQPVSGRLPTVPELAAAAMSAVDLSDCFEGLGTVSDTADDPAPLIRAAFNKAATVMVIAALCMVGIAALLLWWPWA